MKQADGASFSALVFDAQKNAAHIDLAKNALKRMKTLRHPNVLPYIDGIELPNYFYIVTEQVTPLKEALPQTKSNDHQLAWGIYQIVVSPPPPQRTELFGRVASQKK